MIENFLKIDFNFMKVSDGLTNSTYYPFYNQFKCNHFTLFQVISTIDDI